MVTTPTTHQGQPVTLVRNARKGDQGFAEGGEDMVLIRRQDGTERAVPRSEVIGAPPKDADESDKSKHDDDTHRSDKRQP